MGKGKFWVDRSLFSNDIFTAEKANDTSAWMDLIGMAAYKPTHIKIRDVRVQIQRGEIGHSIDFYAKRWRWSKGKVLRYFDFLEIENMVKRDSHRSTITTIISVINYDKYQSCSTTDNTPDRASNETPERTSNGISDGIQLKKENNREELKESIISKNDVISTEQQKENIQITKLLEKWNSNIPSQEYKVKKLSETRKSKLNARLHSFANYHESIEQTFELLCKNIANSDFLNGKKRNGKPAEWDWVMDSDDRWLKILEGKYTSYQEQKSPKHETTPLMNRPIIRFGSN